MRRPHLPASLASAARQLEYALAGSQTRAEAFQKLHALADERQSAALRELEALLDASAASEAGGAASRASALGTLAWLIGQAPDPGRSAAALLEAYRRRASHASATATIVWTEFAGFLTYLGAVLAVLVCVVVVYGVFELPNFRAMYQGFGSSMPALTGAVFGRGALVLTAVLLASVALLVFLGWFVLGLRRRLRRFAPMPATLLGLPLVGSVVSAYHDSLWLAYASLLRAAGVKSASALALGAARLPRVRCPDFDASRVDERAGAVASDLHMAARLGRLDAEADFQQEATADAFLEALARCRRRSRVLLTILVYWLVATYVAAMYLPLFSLGSEI